MPWGSAGISRRVAAARSSARLAAIAEGGLARPEMTDALPSCGCQPAEPAEDGYFRKVGCAGDCVPGRALRGWRSRVPLSLLHSVDGES